MGDSRYARSSRLARRAPRRPGRHTLFPHGLVPARAAYGALCALNALTAAQVDPMGLKHFFEKVLAEEGKSSGGALSKLGTVFSTHPGTVERMGLIEPLPPGTQLRASISDAQWKDLKAICG